MNLMCRCEPSAMCAATMPLVFAKERAKLVGPNETRSLAFNSSIQTDALVCPYHQWT
jgi:hypothetical protein